MTGPSTLPPLNHDEHDDAQDVRGIKFAMCALKSATAASEGHMALIPSIWHLWMARVIYRAICSLSVNTLPCPMGALGPMMAVAAKNRLAK